MSDDLTSKISMRLAKAGLAVVEVNAVIEIDEDGTVHGPEEKAANAIADAGLREMVQKILAARNVAKDAIQSRWTLGHRNDWRVVRDFCEEALAALAGETST